MNASIRSLGAVCIGKLGISSKLLSSSSVLLAATLLGQALTFAIHILVARKIGVDQYGLYSYLFTWVNLLSLMAIMGHDRLLIRFVGAYRAKGNEALLRALVIWTALAVLATSILGASALLTAALLSPPRGVPLHLGAALWAAFLIPLIAAATLAESFLRSMEANLSASLLNRVLRPVLFGLAIAALALLPSVRLDAEVTLAANAVAMLATVGVAIACMWRVLPVRTPMAAPWPVREWLGQSAAFSLNTLALYMNGQLDILILGMLLDSTAVGTYGAVSRLVVVMSFPTTVVVSIIQPMIVRAVSSARQGELQHLTTGAARLAFLATLGPAIVIWVFAEDLLHLFGPSFAEGATSLRILTLGYVLANLVSTSSALLNMCGRQNDATGIMLLGGMLTVILNLVLVPAFGITGAALATALSMVIWNLGLFLAVRWRLGLTAAPFAR